MQDERVSREEAGVFIDQLTESARIGELQIVAPAFLSSTQANGVGVLVVGLGHAAIVES